MEDGGRPRPRNIIRRGTITGIFAPPIPARSGLATCHVLAADLPLGPPRPRAAVHIAIMGEEFYSIAATRCAASLAARHPIAAPIAAGTVEGDAYAAFITAGNSRRTAVSRSNGQYREFKPQRQLRSPSDIRIYRPHLRLSRRGRPPAFQRQTFQQPGFLDVGCSRRPWNFFNQIENSWTRCISISCIASRLSPMPHLPGKFRTMISRETDYGIERASKRGEEVRIGHLIMPNILMTSVPDPLNGWTEHIARRVPVTTTTTCQLPMAHMITLKVTTLHATASVRPSRRRPSRICHRPSYGARHFARRT